MHQHPRLAPAIVLACALGLGVCWLYRQAGDLTELNDSPFRIHGGSRFSIVGSRTGISCGPGHREGGGALGGDDPHCHWVGQRSRVPGRWHHCDGRPCRGRSAKAAL